MPKGAVLVSSNPIRAPATVIVPPSTSSSPLTIFSSVLLPEPLGPSSATTSPDRMLRSTPSKMVCSPYDLRTPVKRISSGPMVRVAAASNTGGGGVSSGGPAGAGALRGSGTSRDSTERRLPRSRLSASSTSSCTTVSTPVSARYITPVAK